jgi:hypothetical protein
MLSLISVLGLDRGQALPLSRHCRAPVASALEAPEFALSQCRLCHPGRPIVKFQSQATAPIALIFLPVLISRL